MYLVARVIEHARICNSVKTLVAISPILCPDDGAHFTQHGQFDSAIPPNKILRVLILRICFYSSL